MVDYQPAWLTDELNKLLARIVGSNARKKRDTVLRLAEGRATGRTDEDTWKLPETCTKTTWHGQRRGKKGEGWEQKPGWEDDPIIQEALQAAERRAHWWQEQAEARRIAKRQEKLAEARDLLADYSPLAVQRLFVLMGQAGNEETRRKAANDILDRADEATATKQVKQESGDHEQRIKFDLSDAPTELLEWITNLQPGDSQDSAEGREGGTE